MLKFHSITMIMKIPSIICHFWTQVTCIKLAVIFELIIGHKIGYILLTVNERELIYSKCVRELRIYLCDVLNIFKSIRVYHWNV
jgi:hypothetical protein